MTLFTAYLAFLLIQSPAAASIKGTVVSRQTGKPLGNATIELRIMGGNTTAKTTTTDGDGKFVLSRLAAGSYRLIARRSGYVQTEFSPLGAGVAGTPVDLKADQQLTGVQLALTATGTISGRIIERDGQPMPNARVQALKTSFQDGHRVFTPVTEVLSNDLGEYRLFWLTPGQYYVNVTIPDGPMGVDLLLNPDGSDNRGLYEGRAQVRPVATTPVGSGASENESHVPIFYPNVSNNSLAEPVNVIPGSEVRGIDIHALPVRARRVRGTITNGAIGQTPAGTIQVRLLPLSAPGTTYQANAETGTGAFEFPKVVPGNYVALATSGGPNGIRARASVEVRDRDIENLLLMLGQGWNLTARVISDPGGPELGPDITRLRVTLRSEPFIAGLPQPGAAVTADGSASIAGILAGEYRIVVTPLLNPQGTAAQTAPAALAGGYVKSIRFGDVNVLKDGLRLDTEPQAEIVIIVGRKPASFEGQVVDDRKQPIPGATVVLVPENGLEYRIDHPVTVADASGRFQFPSVVPGDYKIFAWDNVEKGAWQDRGYIGRYENRASPIHFDEGSAQRNVSVEVLR